jgi:hypothetical protein
MIKLSAVWRSGRDLPRNLNLAREETLRGRHNRKGEQMKSLAIHSALLTGFGALAFIGTVAATTVPANARCMVNEGNGRYTPCEALYKSTKCMVNEGNGRYTPCEALVKSNKAPAKTKK